MAGEAFTRMATAISKSDRDPRLVLPVGERARRQVCMLKGNVLDDHQSGVTGSSRSVGFHSVELANIYVDNRAIDNCARPEGNSMCCSRGTVGDTQR